MFCSILCNPDMLFPCGSYTEGSTRGRLQDSGGWHEFAGGVICHEPAGRVADQSAGELVPSFYSHDAFNNIEAKISQTTWFVSITNAISTKNTVGARGGGDAGRSRPRHVTSSESCMLISQFPSWRTSFRTSPAHVCEEDSPTIGSGLSLILKDLPSY